MVEPVRNRIPVQERGRVDVLLGILDRLHSLRTLTRAKECVAADREEPLSAVASRAKCAPACVLPQEGLLREIISVGSVSCQQTGVPRHVRQPRQRDELKVGRRWWQWAVSKFHGPRGT